MVDTNGEVYNSNLILADAVRPYRRRLRLGHVLDDERLAERAGEEVPA